MKRVLAALVAVVAVSVAGARSFSADAETSGVRKPVLLPNGRTITPAGTLVTTGDFPAGLALRSGGPLFVAGAGIHPNQLESVDPVTLRGSFLYPMSSREPSTSLGAGLLTERASQSGSLALSPDNKTLYAAGAIDGDVMSFSATDPPMQGPSFALPDGQYAGGVAASPDGASLFVTEPLDTTKPPYQRGTKLTRLSLKGGAAVSTRVGPHPLPVAAARVPGAGLVVAVGNRGDGTVSIVDGRTMRVRTTVRVGRQPSNISFTRDGSALLVVSSLDDRLDEIRTTSWRVGSTLSLSSPAGIGAQPDGLTLSPDGRHVYIPLAQDNAVAVVRRDSHGLHLQGRIPTAWWPSAVAFDPSGPALLVATGKGEDKETIVTPPGIDPDDAVETHETDSNQGTSGALERILIPSPRELRAYSRMVERNNGWTASATVAQTCGPPQINHVVLIVRENKTFDEELGDSTAGGDPSRVIYGRAITPNTHAIAERFGLLTAFYADEEISDTGHQALASGLSSDWNERFSQQYVGGHSPIEYAEYASNAKATNYNVDGIQWGPSDYLVDHAWRNHVDVKVFGHAFLHSQTSPARALHQDFESKVMRGMPGFGWDLQITDQARAAYWVKEFRKDVAAKTFPALEVIYLPNDHTGYFFPENKTPPQEVADNDIGTGMIVDALSHSPYWGSSAVMMEEDDAQSGTDHVDVHRSVAFVASPWTKRGYVSTVHHDQTSILRTIELLLGLPPMTEIDATATPFTELWSRTPDMRPYDTRLPVLPTGSFAAAGEGAARLFAKKVFAGRPRWRERDQLPPELQLDSQWMATHGGKHFDASAFAAPIGPVAAGENLMRVGPATCTRR